MTKPVQYPIIDAFVLKHHIAREQDVILQVFSREMGKLPVMARGLLKAKSKLAGLLQPGQRAQINLARGKQMYVVTGAVLVESYKEIREDYRKTLCVIYFGDLLDRLLEEGAPEPEIFDFLDRMLRLAPKLSSAVLCFYFEWHLLHLLGYGITHLDCADCGLVFGSRKVPARAVASGYLLCDECFQGQGMPATLLQPGDRAVLRVFSQREERRLRALYLTRDQTDRLAHYFALRLQDLWGRPLKSRKIFLQMLQ